jgi:hypothetical protein
MVGLALWMAWVFAAEKAGVSYRQGSSFWVLWGITLIMAIWYGNKHHIEKDNS